MSELTEKELFETVPVPRAVARLIIPTIISQIVTVIYNLADTFFIGQIGDPAMVAGDTLGDLSMTWYTHMDPNKTVEICNYLKNHAERGERIFCDIYTDEEKEADPSLEDTGLFFFRGNRGAPFAVTCAGGGFAYVAAMHDSFPHALELSKRGYNAFAIIYRPGWQTAYRDLARALSFIFENAAELGIDTGGYSLWGGSAGARMAAERGSYGAAEYGGDDLPKPSALVMQYTGYSDYIPEGEPATFVCVGDSDGIANWRSGSSAMRRQDVWRYSCSISTPTKTFFFSSAASTAGCSRATSGARSTSTISRRTPLSHSRCRGRCSSQAAGSY